MALVHLDFESQYCVFNQDVYIILPDRPRKTDAAEFIQAEKSIRYSGCCTAHLADIVIGYANQILRHTHASMISSLSCPAS